METITAPIPQAVTQPVSPDTALLPAKPDEHRSAPNKVNDIQGFREKLIEPIHHNADFITHTNGQNVLTELKNDKVSLPNTNKRLSNWEKFEEFFYRGPEWFQKFRDNFCMSLNSFGIVFNTIAVIAINSSIFGEKTTKFLDEKSEAFSKYIIPFTFAWNGLEAAMGKRPLEAIARWVPASLFFVLPFFNLNLATGISSGLNYLFEHVKDRHGDKHPGEGNAWKNTTETLKTSGAIFKDMFRGDQSKEDLLKQLATIFMLVGSMGGLAFARDSRDSLLARLFGNMRNAGGIIADGKLIFNKVLDPLRANVLRTVGAVCSFASVLNILMRWVEDDKLVRTFNHMSIALDDWGLTYWAQNSKRDNDTAQKEKETKPERKVQLERADLHKVTQAAPDKAIAI